MARGVTVITVATAMALLVALTVAPCLSPDVNAGPRDRVQKQRALVVNLPQAVSTAIARNLTMSAAQLETQESEHQRREAFSDFFPSLNVQYQASANRYRQSGNVAGFASAHDSRWTYRGSPGSNPPLPGTIVPNYPYRIDPYKTFTLSATLTQPLFTGGRLLQQYKYTRLGVNYSEIQQELDRQDLILDVHEAYYDIMQGQKLLEVAEQSIVALEALRNQTVEFFKAGVVPKVDVLSTEGQLAQARIQRTQAITDTAKAKARLNWLLRYPPETCIDIVHDLKHYPVNYCIPQIYAIAAQNRLEIRQANISVAQALALTKLAAGSLVPSVSVTVSGSRTNDDWNPLDREAINSWAVYGTLSWDFDIYRARETLKERRAGHALSFVNRQQLVEDIMLAVKESYLDMRKADSDIKDNRKAVEFRKENFRINKERYKEQVATYTEVLDAQRELAQAQGDYYTSLIDYKIYRSILERRMGILK